MTTNTASTFSDSNFIDSLGRVRICESQTFFEAKQTNTFDTQKIWDAVVYDSASPDIAPPSLGGYVSGVNGTTIGVGGGPPQTGIDPNTRLVPLILDDTYADSKAIIQSKEYVQYVIGKSQLIKIAGVFAPQSPKVNQTVRLLCRTTISGVFSDSNYSVEQQDWNVDVFDGSGSIDNPSRILLDFSKVQILEIDENMVCCGRVRFSFNINGVNYLAHEFFASNQSSRPMMQTFSLPVRNELVNEGGRAVNRCGYFDSHNGSFLEISDEFVLGQATTFLKGCSVISEGGKSLPPFNTKKTMRFSKGLNDAFEPLISVRPKLLFNFFENRTQLFASNISFVTQGDDPVEFVILIGGTLTNFNWDETDETISYGYDTAATQITGGLQVASVVSPDTQGQGRASGSFPDIKFRIPTVLSKIDDLVINQEILTVAARTSIGGDALCSMCTLNLIELYA